MSCGSENLETAVNQPCSDEEVKELLRIVNIITSLRLACSEKNERTREEKWKK